MFEEKFQVVIQISAPLIAYGLKGTIHAILAHEFLHFLELIRKISKWNYFLMKFLEIYLKMCTVMKLDCLNQELFSKIEPYLDHITKRFPAGFRDYKLEDKVTKFWI